MKLIRTVLHQRYKNYRHLFNCCAYHYSQGYLIRQNIARRLRTTDLGQQPNQFNINKKGTRSTVFAKTHTEQTEDGSRGCEKGIFTVFFGPLGAPLYKAHLMKQNLMTYEGV